MAKLRNGKSHTFRIGRLKLGLTTTCGLGFQINIWMRIEDPCIQVMRNRLRAMKERGNGELRRNAQ